MSKISLFLFLWLIAVVNVEAKVLPQVAKEKPRLVVPVANKGVKGLLVDSTQIETRSFDEQAIHRYSTQKEFIYDDVAPRQLTLWDRFWNWFWGIINQRFSGPNTGPVLKFILLSLGVGGLVFVIIRIAGADLKIFSGKSRGIEVPYEESLENIHEINFEEQLEMALQQKNYRLAVRLLYLKSLKQLSDRELIDWKIEKTNQMYVLELIDEKQQNKFRDLTSQFEYVWYGDFSVDESSFTAINQSFNQFYQETR